MSLTSCIISPYFKNKSGYALKWYKGKNYGHHRVAYAQHNNIDLEDIKGLSVMHLCDNPPCVNPDHLRLGTQQDNMKDKVNKNRQAVGEQCKNKLTKADVLDIKANKGILTRRELSEKYGVQMRHISRLWNNDSWKHL